MPGLCEWLLFSSPRICLSSDAGLDHSCRACDSIQDVCAWPLWLCRMSEEKRKEFTNTVLAVEFGDLLEWRDKLYKDHFPQV